MLNNRTRPRPLFHGLADPARRAIVERLSRVPAPGANSNWRGRCPVAPAAMQHLGVLEAADWCVRRKAAGAHRLPSSPSPLSRAEHGQRTAYLSGGRSNRLG